MYQSILEHLYVSEISKEDLEGLFIYKGNEVTLTVSPDGEPIQKTLELARKFLIKLEKYEAKALDRVSKEYLSIYNEDWRNENEPTLSGADFLANLKLTHIWFLSTSNVDFYFSENGMFGNHTIIPQAFDGENFTHIDMYG